MGYVSGWDIFTILDSTTRKFEIKYVFFCLDRKHYFITYFVNTFLCHLNHFSEEYSGIYMLMETLSCAIAKSYINFAGGSSTGWPTWMLTKVIQWCDHYVLRSIYLFYEYLAQKDDHSILVVYLFHLGHPVESSLNM